jgi:hypothetical protein
MGEGHGAALKLDVKMRRGELFFKGEKEERPPLHASTSVTPKRGRLTQGGGTMREENSH